ncbi:intradiol ring-cleavage dioxygenase [Deinococcus yavapaiensis]|uniref:Dioxygenase-like protein n=1 Tax=Deinococcus yavapaiensis KR-236 TaxID=694435 RepID=A0A318S660_9DEIO|nr:intradiol ring-cleavage dioxygenase [Deinococcus yavapaiensis]PYE49503.1 dioxygenase-like protein [Deinococcus yavapaiensis KR-236]
MDNDDQQVGQVLSRRRALQLLGLSAGGTAVGAGLYGWWFFTGRNSAGTTGAKSLPGCVVRPAQIEGPYFVSNELNRRDIRANTSGGAVQDGVPLTLEFVVSRVALNTCEPRANVKIDVWQCDALGVYSGVADNADQFDTRGQDFLRGYQLTDANGKASFRTIYPGWYAGRSVHLHFSMSVITDGKVTGEFTTQLYFPDSITDVVHARAPYNTKGQRDRLNSTDILYRNGGSQLLLDLKGSLTEGYTATFDVGLNI